MKYFLKTFCIIMLFAGLSASAMAQEKFEQGKPNNDDYRYLDEYQALKEYIDYTKYPNFKLGAGTTVSEYLSNSTYRKMINQNFTETVAGNAMKMASCVDGNGNMNFTNSRFRGWNPCLWPHPRLALATAQGMVAETPRRQA